jgi:hypothetical protein
MTREEAYGVEITTVNGEVAVLPHTMHVKQQHALVALTNLRWGYRHAPPTHWWHQVKHARVVRVQLSWHIKESSNVAE